MALSVSALADKIKVALDATDNTGSPIKSTIEMTAYATAIITTIMASVVSHAPGTVTGTGVPAGPFIGEASNGIIAGMVPATWLAAMVAGFPTAVPSNLQIEAALSTAYIMGAAKVNFSSGSITGACTATPVNPGPLAAGQGIGGTISGLSGSTWAAALAVVTQGGAAAPKLYDAIANYIMEAAIVTYPIGTVNGTFAVGGGPIIGGFAAGGVIT